MSDVYEKLKILPDLPGCYLMKNKAGTIIYVGKAKNLKRRVSSYFHGAHNAKTTKLVSEIETFDFIITASELESLVLEINLIKQHDPKYNIMLTDDKTYPYIVLTSDANPRLFVVRKKLRKKDAKYYGPYPNVYSARKTCELLNSIYPFRKCANIPDKECLYYHMHNCLAPCIYKEKFDYSEYIKEVNQFLNGETANVVNELKSKMIECSNNLEFEKAVEYRDLINSIEKTTEQQKIQLNDFKSRDVFGYYYDIDEVAIHILLMRNGSIVQNYQQIFSYLDNPIEAIESFMVQYYTNALSKPKEMLVSSDLLNTSDLSNMLGFEAITPLKGKKKELLDMANENAKKDLDNKRLMYKNKVLRKQETCDKLAELLGLESASYIESFDNSNLYGEYPVSAMVVFRNGKPSPKEYRKYHVKMVEGANDYATMKEVIYRRYLRLTMEEKPYPDLIIMDGGLIQVNAAIETLNSLNLNIPVCGIQKDDNHKASVIVYNNREYNVSKNSDIYLMMAEISQTVHDFAISFFRSQKAKGMFTSRLDGIKGLGPKGKEKLLKHFLSIDKIKAASPEEINALGIPSAVAIEVLKHLNEKDDE